MTNREGTNAQFQYWDTSWPEGGIHSFSIHTHLIEARKWEYLRQDLGAMTGVSLEVGSGSGHLSSLLAEIGFTSVLLDYSPAAISCARNSFTSYGGQERKRYVLGDALCLPAATGSVDLVVSCGVLEHFENPLVPMMEMSRVLRPGGAFYADICPLKFRLSDSLGFLYKKPAGWYEKMLNKVEIERLVKDAGLRAKRVFGAGVLPPRDIPLKGRLGLAALEERWIKASRSFWYAFDGTWLGELLGLYYYVFAQKPE